MNRLDFQSSIVGCITVFFVSLVVFGFALGYQEPYPVTWFSPRLIFMCAPILTGLTLAIMSFAYRRKYGTFHFITRVEFEEHGKK